MKEYWMLDYLHAVFPHWGLFESEEEAWDWVATHDPDRRDGGYYTPFKITVNRGITLNVPTTSPERRYANWR